MDLGRLCIENRVLGWLIIIVFVVAGALAFSFLGRYEDPEFTIKDAKVITLYPGASPFEVEQEVTDRVESAIQQLGQVKYITSVSTPGKSEITVTIKDHYDKYSLPQVWDELRRKVNDMQTTLPPGAGPSIVNDDYGQVYGIFLALTGEGFSYDELKEIAKSLRKELLLVPNVARVMMNGALEEQIFIEMSQAKLAQFGISPDTISALLKTQNQVVPSGTVTVDTERIRIQPSGELNSVEAIGDLLIPATKGVSTIYLKDIAQIKRGYEEVPRHLIHFNGQPAITLAIAMVPGENIVKLGKAIENRIHTLTKLIPSGVELNYIYNQPTAVNQSIGSFLINLIEALVIVVAVLLVFMGMRSGILIGIILLLIVLGTFCFMYLFQINLQRISLGALIIALGMLVDNAIVIVDGILVRIQKGKSTIEASDEIVRQTIWPLFAATAVGILAFSGIGLSQDKTGEYIESLFQVILISMFLSWFLAVTIAPMLADYIFKPKQTQKIQDPYQKPFYQKFRRLLIGSIKNRKQALAGLAVMLGLSAFGFTFILPGFFPNATTPIFFVDYWLREGTDIRKTEKDIDRIEKHVLKIDGVKKVSSFIGQGASRFMLVYTPESPNSSYAQLLVEVKDHKQIPKIEENIRTYLRSNYPQADPKYKKITIGPSPDGKIEARFSGSRPDELRQVSAHAQTILLETPGTTSVRDNWRQRIMLSRPEFAETLARATGITRLNLNQTLQMTFGGRQVGLYREKDELIPIVSRLTELERDNITAIYNLFIWSPVKNANIPIQQVVQGFKVGWDDNRLHRRDRKLTITPSADPLNEPIGIVFDRLRPKIEAMKLPVGYELAWGGEYEAQRDAQDALASKVPISVALMILVVILLFSKVRQPLIIWLTVPLSIIGVTIGLLIARQPFDFMALLGFLSLTGMLIKNAIVLIDQIDLEIAQGKEKLQAVVDSTLSRVRPVSLAALTTILGVAPLLLDPFFASMAVLIMSGLAFATILTLFVVPILYTLFFHISSQPSTE